MLKTYIWGFCGLEGKFILDELRRHINVVDWISDQEGAHNIWDFLMPDAMLCAPRCDEAIQAYPLFYRDFFPVYEIMITRRGLHASDVHELTHEFTLGFYYFYHQLKNADVQLVLFSNLPHEGPDYVLYKVARLLGIKTLMAYQSLFKNQFHLTTRLSDFGPFRTIPAIFRHPPLELEQGFRQQNVNMENIEALEQQQNQQWLAQLQLRVTGAVSGLSLRRLNPLRMLKNAIRKRVIKVDLNADYQARLYQLTTPRQKVRELIAANPGKVIYFPMHLQPELTTTSIGGIFQDQLYALEVLRHRLGPDWIILLKENPKQDHFQRGRLFFQRLQAIDNVYLVDKLFPTYELMSNATFTAAITGTAGWETIKGGGKCLAFGQAWYATLPGCYNYVHESFDVDDFLRFLALPAEQDFKPAWEIILKKSGVGIVDPMYAVLLDKFDIAANATTVSDSLLAIIDSEETLWA